MTIAASAQTSAATALGADRLAYSSSHTQRHDHVAAQPGSAASARAREHDRRHAALHVEPAATVHAAVLDPR